YGAAWSRPARLPQKWRRGQCSWGPGPIDIRTRNYVNDGFEIFVDKDGVLAKLVLAVSAPPVAGQAIVEVEQTGRARLFDQGPRATVYSRAPLATSLQI